MKKKVVFVFAAISISCLSLFGQISEGGIPPSFNYENNLRSVSLTPELSVSVELDVNKLMWQDSISTRNGSPLKVAESIPVQINMNSSGQWTTLPDSVKIWRQTVTAKDAVGLIISYDDFYIPKGGKLFIYNKDKSQVLGAYTNQTHPSGGEFATEIVVGDSFTFEYVQSKTSIEEPRLVVSRIGYMYNKGVLVADNQPLINNYYLRRNGTKSNENCRININCLAGQNWQNQKRGVVLYFIDLKLAGGWHACSGSLINNTNQDATPYMLSAQHCFRNDPELNTVISYFEFEFPGCANQTVTPEYKTLVGVTPLVQVSIDGGSDNFLIKYNQPIPESYHPYFNGWDRRNIPAQSGVVIHHPNRDVKKIVTYNKPLVSDSYTGGLGGAVGGHWRVVYDGNSVTEPGSSGSPIFNQDGLIVGTLTGGLSFCEYLDKPDYYGKLWYAWDQYNVDIPYDQQLKKYLDPSNKGVETLKGYDPYDTSGIETEIAELKELVLFPSPVENELNINANSIIRKIKIFDLLGRNIFTQENYNSSTMTLPVSDWKKGVYTILVETESKTISDKFMKK